LRTTLCVVADAAVAVATASAAAMQIACFMVMPPV
jgi:hypothetical protein